MELPNLNPITPCQVLWGCDHSREWNIKMTVGERKGRRATDWPRPSTSSTHTQRQSRHPTLPRWNWCFLLLLLWSSSPVSNHLVDLVVKASTSTEEDPGFDSSLRRGIFPSRLISVTEKMVLRWLPCQAPGVLGSALGLVGPVSVYCDWVS